MSDFPDVSNWQGTIDWGAVRAAGYDRACVKSSEGVGYTDPQFHRNWSNMASAGVHRMAYHFARPDLGNSGPAEARWFWTLISSSGVQSDDVLVLDIEAGNGNLKGWSQGFLDSLSALAGGLSLGLYSGGWFLVPHGITGFGNYWLWDAAYSANQPATPAGWGSIDVWQYTDAARIPGIAGGVDCSHVLNPAVFSGGASADMTIDEHNALMAMFALVNDVHGGMSNLVSVTPSQPDPWVLHILNKVDSIADRSGSASDKLDAIKATLGAIQTPNVDVKVLAAEIVAKLPGSGLDPAALATAVANELAMRLKAQ